MEEKIEKEEASQEDMEKEEAAQAQEAECGASAKDGGAADEPADGETPKECANGKEEKKDAKDRLIEELQDKNKRQMAEFVNFRNRTEKEMAARYELGARDVIEKILSVADNFERGFDSLSDKERQEPFAAGMDKVFRQLAKTLEDMDVKPIEALGAPFDPDFHNAVMHVEDENAGENVVVEEFQKGYTYRGVVVRHSMVKVAN